MRTLLPVLGTQKRRRLGGNQGRDALKLRLYQRPELRPLVLVPVLAAPFPRVIPLPHGRDVDVHAAVGVDPAGVNDVITITHTNLTVVGVDVEQVRLGDELAVGVAHLVPELGEVELRGDTIQGFEGKLHVNVGIPGHDAASPPPAHERAVGQPRLDFVVVRDVEVAPDEVLQDGAPLVGRQFLLEVPRVVVHELVAASWFRVVLGRAGAEVFVRVSLDALCRYGGRYGERLGDLDEHGALE